MAINKTNRCKTKENKYFIRITLSLHLMSNQFLTSTTLILLLTTALSGCDETSVQRGSNDSMTTIDSTQSTMLNIAGKLFSVPSPIQTAILIRDTKSPYRRDQLSDPKSLDQFSSKYLKALNLGIYGTDMAYASLYEDGQSAVRSFKAVDELANQLEVKGAINKDVLRKLSENLEKPDSLILLSSQFYQQADEYLKNNSRAEVAAAVLAGGWLEATHLTIVAARGGNKEARTRLAEQRDVIGTVCDVLQETADETFTKDPILGLFKDLNVEFRGVDYNYTYIAPNTDAAANRTVINSTSTYSMTDSLFERISGKTAFLRDKITLAP